jgi:hypothetical protein
MSRSFWLLRWYQWVWDADVHDVNFCKFFWGVLFSPVGFALIAGGWLAYTVAKPIKRLHIPTPGQRGSLVLAVIAIELGVAVITLLALLAPMFIVVTLLFFVGVVVVIGTTYFYAEYKSRSKVLQLLSATADRVLRAAWAILLFPLTVFGYGVIGAAKAPPTIQAASAIRHGAGIFPVMYHSLKDRTCPIIQVTE